MAGYSDEWCVNDKYIIFMYMSIIHQLLYSHVSQISIYVSNFLFHMNWIYFKRKINKFFFIKSICNQNLFQIKTKDFKLQLNFKLSYIIYSLLEILR